jgi:hypothetical protein
MVSLPRADQGKAHLLDYDDDPAIAVPGTQ